jgi:hypothetical protein
MRRAAPSLASKVLSAVGDDTPAEMSGTSTSATGAGAVDAKVVSVKQQAQMINIKSRANSLNLTHNHHDEDINHVVPSPHAKSSIYLKKAENFMTSLNTRLAADSGEIGGEAASGGAVEVVGSGPIGSWAASLRSQTARLPASGERGLKPSSQSPPGSIEPASEHGSFEIGTIHGAAGSTPKSSRFSISSATGSLGYSVSSSGKQSGSESLAIESLSPTSSNSGTNTPSHHNSGSLSRSHSKWAIAGPGKTWQRISLGGNDVPAESSAHLKYLQDELQRAVQDLGKLVGDESGSAKSTPQKADA